MTARESVSVAVCVCVWNRARCWFEITRLEMFVFLRYTFAQSPEMNDSERYECVRGMLENNLIEILSHKQTITWNLCVQLLSFDMFSEGWSETVMMLATDWRMVWVHATLYFPRGWWFPPPALIPVTSNRLQIIHHFKALQHSANQTNDSIWQRFFSCWAIRNWILAPRTSRHSTLCRTLRNNNIWWRRVK